MRVEKNNNKNENINLSVAIPTYNGAKYIREALDSVISQVEAIDEKIEILVSDNASTDETPMIVKSYEEKYPKLISYYRNDKSLEFDNASSAGYDMNIDLLFKRAKGKYVWTLSDSEVLKPNILKVIMKELKKNIYTNILLNFEIYSELKQKIEVENNFGINEDKVFYSKNDFFRNTKYGITPLPANIILKKSWDSVSKNVLSVEGWCHVERIIDILSYPDYKKSLYFSRVCFTLVREKNGWWTKNGKLFIHTIALREIIKNMKYKGYSKGTIKLLLNESNKSFPGIITQSKLHGLELNFDIILKTIRVCDNKLSFWMKYFPLLLIPSNVYKFVFKIYKITLINKLYKKLRGKEWRNKKIVSR